MPRISALILPAMCVLCLQNTPTLATDYTVPPEQQDSYSQALEQLDAYMEFLAKLRAAVDRSQFDTDVVLDDLDYEREAIENFVTNEIHFEPYSGLLRGVQGTLIARAGNTLDQAALLASLLKDAGFEARIAATQLTDEAATQLLNQIRMKATDPMPVGDEAQIETIIRERATSLGWSKEDTDAWVTKLGDETERSRSDLVERFETENVFLMDTLKKEGVTFDGTLLMSELIEEAKDYFWVQHRDSPSEPWTDSHPAWRSFPSAIPLQPREVFNEDIPQHLTHRIRFQAFIEQQIVDRVEEHIVVPAWERPAANLLGTPLTFSITSRGLLALANGTSDELPKIDNDMFIPSFSQASPSVAFNFFGSTVPIDAAFSAYAGVFETVTNKADKAVSALIGLGSGASKEDEPDAARRLKSVKVRYTTIAPNGSERTMVRTVFDADRVSQWADLVFDESLPLNHKQYLMLTRVLTIGVATGKGNAAYALDQLLESYLNRRTSMEMALAMQHQAQLSDVPQATGSGSSQIAWIGMPGVDDLFSAYPDQKPSSLLYQNRPGIVVHQRSFPAGGTVAESIDVVDLSQRSLMLDDDSIAISPKASLKAGVWVTVSESALVGDDSALHWDTAKAMAAARAEEQDIILIKPDDRTPVPRLKMDEHTKQLIHEDLDNGYIVVVPDPEQQGGGDWSAWWRVDVATGQTIGISQLGGGQSTTETMVIHGIQAGFLGATACYGLALVSGGAERGAAKAWTCVGFGVATGCFVAGLIATSGAGATAAPKLGKYCFAAAAIITLGLNVPNVGQG